MSRITNQRFGQYPNWDDLKFPAQGINPPGLVSDPDVATDGTLLFDAASTELIAGVAQMPHTWAEGTGVRPHVHWVPTDANSGNILWRFEYELLAIGDVPTGTYTTMDLLSTADAGKYDIDGFGEIDMTGYEASALVLWKVSRIGGDVTDTYASDVKFYEFDIHYRKDSLGSEREFLKYTLGE